MCAMNLIYIGEESVRLCTIVRFARILANHLSNYVLGVAGKKTEKRKEKRTTTINDNCGTIMSNGSYAIFKWIEKAKLQPQVMSDRENWRRHENQPQASKIVRFACLLACGSTLGNRFRQSLWSVPGSSACRLLWLAASDGCKFLARAKYGFCARRAAATVAGRKVLHLNCRLFENYTLYFRLQLAATACGAWHTWWTSRWFKLL